MVTGFGIEMPRIFNEDLFEALCLDMLVATKDYDSAMLNGRRGQRQDGVDIFARNIQSRDWIGLQCKVRETDKLSKQEVDSEITKALGFNPRLADYHFYTTSKRDSIIQEYVRVLSDRHEQSGLFRVHIHFWDDLESQLNEDQYRSVHYKYYRNLYTNIRDDGYSFGKLVSLTVAHGHDVAHYELMIGRVYKKEAGGYYGLDYWKNINFIVNMNQRSFETFPKQCFPTDLEIAFINARDRHLISMWLNSINDIDRFLKDAEDQHRFSISDQQFRDYLLQCGTKDD